MMYDLAKMFLYCFNHWKLETPTVHGRSSPTDDLKTYKENYTRYMCMYMYTCIIYVHCTCTCTCIHDVYIDTYSTYNVYTCMCNLGYISYMQ